MVVVVYYCHYCCCYYCYYLFVASWVKMIDSSSSRRLVLLVLQISLFFFVFFCKCGSGGGRGCHQFVWFFHEYQEYVKNNLYFVEFLSGQATVSRIFICSLVRPILRHGDGSNCFESCRREVLYPGKWDVWSIFESMSSDVSIAWS